MRGRGWKQATIAFEISPKLLALRKQPHPSRHDRRSSPPSPQHIDTKEQLITVLTEWGCSHAFVRSLCLPSKHFLALTTLQTSAGQEGTLRIVLSRSIPRLTRCSHGTSITPPTLPASRQMRRLPLLEKLPANSACRSLTLRDAPPYSEARLHHHFQKKIPSKMVLASKIVGATSVDTTGRKGSLQARTIPIWTFGSQLASQNRVMMKMTARF